MNVPAYEPRPVTPPKGEAEKSLAKAKAVIEGQTRALKQEIK